jgi:hypothetical protein
LTGLVQGEPHYDELERQLALGQVNKVPTITLERDANGAPHPDASAELGRNTTLRCMHTRHNPGGRHEHHRNP